MGPRRANEGSHITADTCACVEALGGCAHVVDEERVQVLAQLPDALHGVAHEHAGRRSEEFRGMRLGRGREGGRGGSQRQRGKKGEGGTQTSVGTGRRACLSWRASM